MLEKLIRIAVENRDKDFIDRHSDSCYSVVFSFLRNERVYAEFDPTKNRIPIHMPSKRWRDMYYYASMNGVETEDGASLKMKVQGIRGTPLSCVSHKDSWFLLEFGQLVV